MSLHYVKPKKILEELKLLMGVAITLEDPISRLPITIGYENLHALLIIDIENLTFDGQVVANLYAEMARMQRAAEWAAERADVRYVKWKAQMSDAFREQRMRERPKEDSDPVPTKGKRKSSGPKAPTGAEVEAYYRSHADYERLSEEGKRMKAVAGLFEDLKWAFKMKSEQMLSASRQVGSYAATDRDGERAAQRVAGAPTDEDSVERRFGEYKSFVEEASALAQRDNSSADAQALLSSIPQPDPSVPPPKPTRTPTPL